MNASFGNRPRQLQHPMICPCRQMQLLHRRLEQLLTWRIRLAELAHLRRPHLGVAGQLRAFEAFQLAFTRSLHSCADRPGILDLSLVGQLFIIDSRHLHMNVDTVHQRTADLLLVAGDGHGGTTAFFDGVAVKSTRAGVRVAVVGAI